MTNRSNRGNRTYDSYGNLRKPLNLKRQTDERTTRYIQLYNQIDSGELNESNCSKEQILEIYNLAKELNSGTIPKKVSMLYFNIMNGDD